MRNIKKTFLVTSIVGMSFFALTSFAEPVHIKSGVIFPEGSTWMNSIHQVEREVTQKTDGGVTFTTYGGGVQGDEPAMLTKIRLDQLNAGMFTSVALSKIDPAIIAFELPLLYQNGDYGEVDYLYQKMFPVFHQRFEERGFELIALAGQGFIYLYTTRPVKSFEDFQKLKVELWSGHAFNKDLIDAFGLTGIPVSFPEILTSLQTGLLDVVFAPPVGMVSLQWNTEVKYAIDMPVLHGVAGIVVSKKTWDQIPKASQGVFREAFQKSLPSLQATARRDDKVIWEALPEQGIQILAIDGSVKAQFEEKSKKMWQGLAGKYYPQAILDQMLAYLKEYRAKAEQP